MDFTSFFSAFFTGASKFLSSSDKTHQNSNPHAKMNSNIRYFKVENQIFHEKYIISEKFLEEG